MERGWNGGRYLFKDSMKTYSSYSFLLKLFLPWLEVVNISIADPNQTFYFDADPDPEPINLKLDRIYKK